MPVELNFTWPSFWLTLGGLYLLLCVFYSYDRLFNRGSTQDLTLSLLLCLGLPVVGFFLLWMMDMAAMKKENRDFSGIFRGSSVFAQDLQTLRPVNLEEERNRVPMMEKLSLDSYELRRQSMMETLSDGDAMDYLEVLRMAMENDDSETSHYASSIMMMLQSRVQSSVQQKLRILEQQPENQAAALACEEELYKLLSSGLLDAQSLRRYEAAYSKLSDTLLSAETPEECFFRHRAAWCLRQGDYAMASRVLDRYLTLYPESEEAVYDQVCLYIGAHDIEGLRRFYLTLGARPVKLTSRTLGLLRVFAPTSAGEEARA